MRPFLSLVCSYVTVVIAFKNVNTMCSSCENLSALKEQLGVTYVFLGVLRSCKSCIQQEDSFYQQIGLKFVEETSKMLHLEHGFVWC